MAVTWKSLRTELELAPEEENAVRLEKELIRTMVQIREERGLTQAQLAELCQVKQPVIARMESAVHSPQLNSLLKVLMRLGYTLRIVPMSSDEHK